ncbi:hypothetical protein LTR78_000568 [Recurvomyces mirabilis]|uniref:Autophagy-related protein 14 n=1 Tax=Recurvomyces mirabilis TaxID=574656 RepID=A0AAE0WYB4_9PEZI|nr:hypothetical protein LTR78_000568 [Recurvomyces mirabilis]KAK5162222.1 hypothetical protein LTS14_000568 [Recurvomyces mirabilis]
MAFRSATTTSRPPPPPPPPPSHQDSFAPRSKPWLLHPNRKVRNLVSISLRNLSLAPPSPLRRRGKTIDDDAVPQSLTSPAKLVALREQRPLEHSRSSSDLRGNSLQAVAEDALTFDQDRDDNVLNVSNGSPKSKTRPNGAPRTPQRPVLSKMRRRSTLEWANATPQRRQERLENVTSERMADVFFSLHVDGITESVYVSETIERTMNPTFRHIDWSLCGPGITRMDHLTLRFWIKRAKTQNWKQLLEFAISLPSLQYLGKSLDQLHYALPENAVVFHLTDGVYTSFPSLSSYVPPPTGPPARSTSARTLPTASFDALLRLSKLDDSIQDALVTRDKIAADLEALLKTNQTALTDRDRVPEAQDRLKTIDYAKKTVEKQLVKARKQQDEKRASLQSRRDLMASDLNHRKKQVEETDNARPELPLLRDEHKVKQTAIRSQRRRICLDLSAIYPITPHPSQHKHPLAFTIRTLYLPDANDLDTTTTSTNPTTLSAALGHTSHLIHLLSFYLRLPLPYPLHPHSSTTTITDPLSLLKTAASTTKTYTTPTSLRTYPLFPQGVPRFRFDYAVFLLGKDIQILVEEGFGGRVVDVRQMLPNLGYLFFVATAGEGEVVGRKAGGVKGLLGMKGVGAAGGRERRGSGGSEGSWWSGGVEVKGKHQQASAVESLRRSAKGAGGKKQG